MSQMSLVNAERFEDDRQRKIDEMPAKLKRLGVILRQSVADGDLNPLAAFLTENEISFSPERLSQMRDYLIVTRLDMRDLEADARRRLRDETLDRENPLLKSADYRYLEAAGVVPRCRDCKYFVTPPKDGSPNGDRACTSFGTKGADIACFGFTSKS